MPEGNLMKRQSLRFYMLALIAVLAAASILSVAAGAAPLENPPAARALQDTVVVTVEVTPPVVIMTGTGVIVPTGGNDPTGSWLFLGILVVAGLAFLMAILALMRRPYP
jgi:hypothetical protein